MRNAEKRRSRDEPVAGASGGMLIVTGFPLLKRSGLSGKQRGARGYLQCKGLLASKQTSASSFAATWQVLASETQRMHCETCRVLARGSNLRHCLDGMVADRTNSMEGNPSARRNSGRPFRRSHVCRRGRQISFSECLARQPLQRIAKNTLCSFDIAQVGRQFIARIPLAQFAQVPNSFVLLSSFQEHANALDPLLSRFRSMFLQPALVTPFVLGGGFLCRSR